MDRKKFLQINSMGVAWGLLPGFLKVGRLVPAGKYDDLFFKISLAESSFTRSISNGEMNHLDFAAKAKNDFDINAVEYVSQFFPDKAENKVYLDEMNSRCSDLGIDQVLIMVDEGGLALTNERERKQAVESHYKWVKAAKHLNCSSIRVLVNGKGTPDDEVQKKAAVNSLRQLSEFAKDYDINILAENHGGLSSYPPWLSDVVRQVDLENCGTNVDFANFCWQRAKNGNCKEYYNRNQGVLELMPWAKAVDAKSYAFDDKGEETMIDYKETLKTLRIADYKGYIAIEYEGNQLSEADGVQATKDLLLKMGKEFS